ncbi:hypothetical protein [Citrobacter freundii]|uniref:hypothetical protein n=1 Tax=Citrobacter freundii TaxID=546 RepID=UPI003CC7DB3B
MTTNHPAHGPVSLDRLHQISETLSKASAQSDVGNLGCAMSDAVKVIDGAIAAFGTEPVAYMTYKGYLLHAADPKLAEYSDPTPLYTAPPAPVSVPAAMEMDDDFDSAFEHGKAVGWNACRAALLQAEPVSNSDELPLDYLQGHKDGLEWAAQLAEANHPQTGDWLYDDPIELARAIRKGPDMPTSQDGNSPVTPDGLALVPKKLTAENGAKSVLSGEFSETKFINCPECFGDDDCETCDGSGRIEITVPVSWTNIKAIWAKGVEHFEAAPQQEVKSALEHGMRRYAGAMQKLSEGDD